MGIHKLPSEEKLQRQMDALQGELAAARKEKQALLKEQKTLGIIESNYEVMLKNAGVEVPEAEKEMTGKAKEEVIS